MTTGSKRNSTTIYLTQHCTSKTVSTLASPRGYPRTALCWLHIPWPRWWNMTHEVQNLHCLATSCTGYGVNLLFWQSSQPQARMRQVCPFGILVPGNSKFSDQKVTTPNKRSAFCSQVTSSALHSPESQPGPLAAFLFHPFCNIILLGN